MFLGLVLLSLFSPPTQASVYNFGSCPTVKAVENFVKASYLGVWYEYSNVFEIFQIGAKCVRATYTAQGDKIGVKNEAVNQWWNSIQQVQGSGRPADPAKPNSAELFITFQETPFQNTAEGKVDPNYRVVDTDYVNYAVVYNCMNLPVFKKESLWLLTRAQKPNSTIVDPIYKKMEQLGLPVMNLEKTIQDGCTILPQI